MVSKKKFYKFCSKMSDKTKSCHIYRLNIAFVYISLRYSRCDPVGDNVTWPRITLQKTH